MRRPDFGVLNGKPTGHAARDERGNAVWECAKDPDATWRLHHPGLSLADEVSTELGAAKPNKTADKFGYSPYESGLVEKKSRAMKRDLRALSKWIQLQIKRAKDADG